jgi:predicted metal-dependent phosphotriesterase family hydrolase
LSTVRTVRGDIPAAELGICDAHDPLFLHMPALAGQELDDEVPEGLPGNGPKAGMIKVAGGFHGLDDYTRRVMTAAAQAHPADS